VIFLSRLIAASAYAGAAFLFGLALGERGELGFVQHVFTAVIPIATIILTLYSRHARAEVFATGLLMFAGLFLGQRAFNRAFDECPARATIVRAAILEHRERTGDYPSRLQDLGIELPCGCILRKTILHYLANERAFRLWITNDAKSFDLTATGKSSDRSRIPTRSTR